MVHPAFAVDAQTNNTSNIANSNHPDLRGFDPSLLTGPNDPFPDTTQPCCLGGSPQFGQGLGLNALDNIGGGEINQNCNHLASGVAQSSLPAVTLPATHPQNVGSIPDGGISYAPFPWTDPGNCDTPLPQTVYHSNLLFATFKNGLLSMPKGHTTACDTLVAAGGSAVSDRCNEITFGFLQDVQAQGQVMDLSFSIRSLTDANGALIGNAEGTFTQSVTENGTTTACSGAFTFDTPGGFVVTSGPLHEC